MLAINLSRLLLGLMVAWFHRPIADFILTREHALDSFFRSRGVHLPSPPSQATAQNLYFGLGIFISLFSIASIWTTL
jgi:hypothetical protein